MCYYFLKTNLSALCSMSVSSSRTTITVILESQLNQTFSDVSWQGAFFQFLNITNRILTAREFTLVNFTFHVIDSACSPLEIKYIQIRKNLSRLCEFETNTGPCVVSPPDSFCYCVPNSRSFSFIKTLQRSDKTQWKWVALGKQSKVLAEENFIFDITYQANVTHLDIQMSNGSRFAPVLISNSVRIICSWINGNPPTEIRLLNANGNVLKASNKSGDIIYIITHVQCDDAGIIKCEAEGSERNMSVPLLVVCPPSFDKTSLKQFNGEYGKISELSFKIRAYTSFIRICNLRHLLTEVGIAGYHAFQCTIYSNGEPTELNKDTEAVSLLTKCGCRILGIAPDFTLIVHLYNTTESDTGRWQLTLSNDIGSKDVDFGIQVNKGPPKFVNFGDINVTATLGSNVQVAFSMFTHSLDFTVCQLSKYKDLSDAAFPEVIIMYKCSFQIATPAFGKPKEIKYEIPSEKCFCSMNGTSPNMNVHIVLYDINEQDNGQWSIKVANKVGSGEADFKLQILKGETESNTRTDSTIIVSTMSGALALTIISIVVILLFFIKRGGTIYDRPKQAAPQEIASYRIISVHEAGSPITESTHEVTSLYEEISHVFTTTTTGNNCETRGNTQRCNENQQGDYVEAISDDLRKESPSTPSSSTSSDSTSSRRRGYLHAVSEISGTKRDTDVNP